MYCCTTTETLPILHSSEPDFESVPTILADGLRPRLMFPWDLPIVHRNGENDQGWEVQRTNESVHTVYGAGNDNEDEDREREQDATALKFEHILRASQLGY